MYLGIVHISRKIGRYIHVVVRETESEERRAEKAGGGGDNLEGTCLNELRELPFLITRSRRQPTHLVYDIGYKPLPAPLAPIRARGCECAHQGLSRRHTGSGINCHLIYSPLIREVINDGEPSGLLLVNTEYQHIITQASSRRTSFVMAGMASLPSHISQPFPH